MADLSDVADKRQEASLTAMPAVVLAGGDDAPTLDGLIMAYVHAMLRLTRGNQTAAARRLGVTRWRLRRLLEREAA